MSNIDRNLHIFTLSAFAFAQPLFDVLAKNAEFFAVRQHGAVDIVLFVLILSAALPAIILILYHAISISCNKIKHYIYAALLCFLISLCLMPVIKKVLTTELSTTLFVVLILAIIIVYLYNKHYQIRLFLSYLSPAILIFPLMFLFFSDVRYLIITPDEPTIEIPIIKSDTPIIMIVFDELPLSTLIAEDNKIDSALFPGFNLLAQSSTMFTNAVSVAEYTTRAVPALLTGIYPASKSDESGVNKSVEDWVGMPSYIYHPKNLFTALSGRYDLRVFETVTTLCPDKLCPHDENTGLHLDQRLSGLFMDLSLVYLHIILPQSSAENLPRVDMGWTDFMAGHGNNEQVTVDDSVKFDEFIDSLTPSASGTPVLYFHHATLPHRPWIYLPSGNKYATTHAEIVDENNAMAKKYQLVLKYQRHILQTMYADSLLLKALEKLQQNGIYDSALIIVVTDHGASFTPGENLRMITSNNVSDILNVPLFIKLPGQIKSEINNSIIRSVDILPTIFHFINEQLPWSVDGSVIHNKAPLSSNTIRYVKKSGDFAQVSYQPEDKLITMKNKLELFGTTGTSGLYGGVKYARLIGQGVHANECINSIAGREIFDDADKYNDINLTQGEIPAFVSGAIPENIRLDATDALAVTINNHIAGVVSAASVGGGSKRFQLMVDEQYFIQGKNDLGLFSIASKCN